jgi:DNA-binding transcriptional LysR family regulator
LSHRNNLLQPIEGIDVMESMTKRSSSYFKHLDLALLRSFVLIADGKSFGETAVLMDRSPSAITLQIQKLEDFFGAKLLNRSGRTITLTAVGELLLADARKILSENDEVIMDLSLSIQKHTQKEVVVTL